MEEQFYLEVLDNLDEGVYFVDTSRRITFWNSGAERITGFSAAEVIGHRCSEGLLRHVDDAGNLLCTRGCPLLAVMKDGHPRLAEVYLHHKAGHRVAVAVRGNAIRDQSGEVVGSVETFTRRGATSYAQPGRESEALTDVLTGVGNRRFGEAQLESILSVVADGVTTLGVLFIDVDHFKAVNDTYGHRTGDNVLRMVGQDIANGLDVGHHPIRWGGEEFLALIPGASHESLLEMAEKLRMLVEHSWIQRGDSQVRVTISTGAALAEAGESAADLLDRADRLMYMSKSAGRNLVTSESGIQPRRSGPDARGRSAWSTSALVARAHERESARQ